MSPERGTDRPSPAGTRGDAYVEAVLAAVEAVPPGRVTTYGDLAALVAEATGLGGGPRQVGRVMALYGGTVPWWRVVRADGRPARGLEERAAELLRDEGTPMRGSRVVLPAARFGGDPQQPAEGPRGPRRKSGAGFPRAEDL